VLADGAAPLPLETNPPIRCLYDSPFSDFYALRFSPESRMRLGSPLLVSSS